MSPTAAPLAPERVDQARDGLAMRAVVMEARSADELRAILAEIAPHARGLPEEERERLRLLARVQLAALGAAERERARGPRATVGAGAPVGPEAQRQARAGAPPVAVMDGAGVLHGVPGFGVAPSPETSAGELFALCAQHGLAQLWVSPAWARAARLPERVDTAEAMAALPFVASAGAHGWDVRPGPPSWLHGWPTAHGEARAVVLPHLDVEAPWSDAPDAAGLLDAIELCARVVRRYERSPASTLGRLLLELHRGRAGVRPLHAPEVDWPEVALDGATERPLCWARELTDEERGAAWLDVWDVNAAYLAACSSLAVGKGRLLRFRGIEPEHGARLIAGGAPGYFRLADAQLAQLDPLLGVGGPWVTRPTVELLTRPRPSGLGLAVELTDAYVWQWTERPLEPWYRRLREARATLRADGGPAAAIVADVLKGGYSRLLGGSLASPLRRPGDPLKRPDVRHAVIAAARANVVRSLLRLPSLPWAVWTDAAYVPSTQDHPLDAAPPGLRLGDNPGAWKHAGRVPMRDVLARIDPGLPAGRMLPQLTRAVSELRA